ncbi:MAG: MFS transporter [Dehalococcoidia bacterium]
MARPTLPASAGSSDLAARSSVKAPRGGTFAALAVPFYGRLWMSGWLWNLTRWMGVFLGSYLVTQLTGSPILVQLVGAAFFAPMFFAGALGGVISDRFDRRRTILAQLLILIPIAVGMSLIVIGGGVRVWMIYPFMLAIGLGGVIDMTSRRALVWDFVGEERVTNALALESLSMTGGNMLGSLVGGAVINFIGTGQAFMVIAVCYVGSFLFLLGVPVETRTASRPARTSILRDIFSGFRLARKDRALVSILGVTVLMNGFYFSFTPLVPVFAERLEVNALFTGLLASASGLGSMIGSFVIAARSPHRRGLIYVGGSLIALASLSIFAAAIWYPMAFLALVIAGVGSSGFGTMQSVLVMSTTGPEMRGRAMGLLSMAIGVLPFGMIALGLVAQQAGAPAAVLVSVAVGLSAMLLWNARWPQARRLT